MDAPTFEVPLTTDKNAALRALHLPGGVAGSSASPYFCLSDLAKNWPSKNTANRREAVMITDGIDPYNVHFDPEDPYVNTAIHDAIRAGIVVDAIYWHDMGIASRVGFLANGGQNLLGLVSGDTGGSFYYQGLANAVSFQPFFADLSKRLNNQYELDFMTADTNKPEIEGLKLTVTARAKIDAPQEVYVHPGAE